MVSHNTQSPHQHQEEKERAVAAGSSESPAQRAPPDSQQRHLELARKLNLFRNFFGHRHSQADSRGKQLSGSPEQAAASGSGSSAKKQPSQRNCCLSLMSRSFAGQQRQLHPPHNQQQQQKRTISEKQRKTSSVNERRASSSNQVDHLVRMILDKNSPVSEERPVSGRRSSISNAEMLILLGSARCLSGPIQLAAPTPPTPIPQPSASLPSAQPQAQLLSTTVRQPQPPQQVSEQAEQPRSRGNRRQTGRLVGALMPRSLDRQQQDRLDQERLDQLISLLDQLPKNSSAEPSVITGSSALRPSTSSPAGNSSALYLEQSWADLVQVSAVQSSEIAALSGQQDAIWELLSTEAFYIERIKVVVELFLATLLEVQRHSLLLEVDVRRVLGNIDEVYAANCAFWNEHLLPMLEAARSTRQPLDPSSMRNAFVQVRSLFKPYYRYCWDYGACLRNVKELSTNNELFKVYMAWCESQKDCERLRLADLMAKPMQRLTRYPLLLKAIQKRCERPDQSSALADMVGDASRFVLSVDLELRKRDDARWLLLSERRIDSYDIGTDVYSDEIERLVRSRYSNFDLQTPLFRCAQGCQRQLLFDSSRPRPTDGWSLGQLKFRDGQMSGKLDVVLLLFTDHLFVCKQTQAAGRARTGAALSLAAVHSSARNLTNAGPSGSALLRPPTSDSSGAVHMSAHQASPTAGRQWRARTSSNSHVETARPSSLSPRASSLTLAPAGACHSASSQDLRLSGELSLSESRHASVQSLAGSAARDFFRRSADAGSSADNLMEECEELDRLCADSDSTTPSRLRVIRSPYPIERLVLHELKGGASVFCCQLNDARTVANSFVLYTQAGSEASASHQAADSSSERPGVTTRRRWSDTRWRSPQCNGASSPARQLIQMIRQAQVRYQTAATFHGVRLTEVADTATRELSSSSAESKPPSERAQRTRLTSWSSFRQSNREKKLRELADSSERVASVSSNEAAPEEPTLGQPANAVPRPLSIPLAKAALEQYQAMLLNHGLYERLNVINSKWGSTCDERNPASDQSPSTNTDLQLQPTLLGASGSQSSVFEEPARSCASPVRPYAHLLSPNSYALAQPQQQSQQQPQQQPQQQQQQHQQQQQPEATISATGSGRRHFSRSARVSNNLELSSDAEVGPQARAISTNTSPLTSSSSSTHSSLIGQPAQLVSSVIGTSCANSDCGWRRKSWHMVADAQVNAAGGSNPLEPTVTADSSGTPQSAKTSPRRHLSALRRQNVILSVSGEHQPGEQMVRRAHQLSYATKLRSLCLKRSQPDNSDTTTTTTSGPSVGSSANNPPLATSEERNAPGSSQATTVDQMSVTFDDCPVNELPERPRAQGATSLDQPGTGRATSFELGNLRANRANQPAQVDVVGCSAGGVRSASMETSGRRAQVSVTLTLPNNSEAIVTCAGQTTRQQQQQDSQWPVNSRRQLEGGASPTAAASLLYLDIPSQRSSRSTRGSTEDSNEPLEELSSALTSSESPLNQVLWTRLLANESSCSSECPARELVRQRPKLTLCLEPRSLEREPVEVPVLNITTASPQTCDSSCEFLASCSSESPVVRTRAHSHSLTQSRSPEQTDVLGSRFSSPDWSAENEEPVRRATSTNALEFSSPKAANNTGSDESMHFLRRCQNYLRSQRQNRRLSKMSLMKATKIDLDSSSRSQDSIRSQPALPRRQVSPQAARLRLALSEAEASEQQSECEETQALIDINCLSNLVHPREHKSVTGYLGFHEKLQLHNERLLEEERKRREQRRRLTRSATGEIFDSLLRATSKVSGNSRRADDRSDHH